VVGERQLALAQCPARDLVYRVVPADVFAQHEQFAVAGEQAGRVQAAGAGEHPLRLAQTAGERGEHGRGDRRVIQGQIEAGPDPDRLDAVLAAHAAGAGGDESPVRRRDGDVRPRRDSRHVLIAHPDLGQVVQRGKQALGVQEPGSQVDIVAGSPHGHGQRHVTDPYFQRLLHRQQVGPLLDASVRTQPDPEHPTPRRLAAHMPRLRVNRKNGCQRQPGWASPDCRGAG